MFTHRRIIRFIIFMLVIALGQPSVTYSSAATIKIALLVPMTGGVSFMGADALKGAQYEVSKWNAAGGVLGQTIELVPFDSMCNSNEASARATEVVAQGIHYIIGEICSSASIPISNIAEANGILQITPTSTNPAVTVDSNTGRTKNFVFRACFIDTYQGEMMARFAKQQGLDKVVLLLDPNNPYSGTLYNGFKATFSSLGGQIAGELNYDPNASDYSDLINQMKTASPNAIYLPDYYTVVNKIASQAKADNLIVPFLGGDGWDSPSLNLTATDGSFFTNHFSVQDTRPIVQQFVTDFKAANLGADPSAIAALTADAVHIVLKAIQQANVDNPAVVKDQLMKNEYQTVTGKVVFNSQHNPTKNLVINQVASNSVNFFQSYLPNGSLNGKVLKTNGTPITDHPIYVKAVGNSIGADTREVLVSNVDGSYSIQGLFPGSYKLIGNSMNSSDYTMVHYVNQLNSDLATPVQLAANQTLALLDIHLDVPLIETALPAAPLVFTHTQTNGVSTQISIPVGAVSSPTELRFSPGLATTQGAFVFAGAAFNLEAYQSGVPVPNFNFLQPISITIHYTDDSIGALREEFLRLDYWNVVDQKWEDALCPGQSYTRDNTSNTITVPICHLSSFSLFGHNFKAHIPIILRP